VALVFGVIKRNLEVKLTNMLDEYRRSSGFDETVFNAMTSICTRG
jgi:hypothetical protein